MRRKTFCIAASCILALAGLLPVFSSGVSPASMEKDLYSFTGGSDGAYPRSDLTIDSAGNLYGTTSDGGAGTACTGGCGTVFELKRVANGWKEEILYSFAGCTDGALPEAGVIFDNAGSLYGTTASGGGESSGTVFKLAPNSHGGWTETVIYSFSFNGSSGVYPLTDLVLDAKSNLFGTTSQGGTGCNGNGCGTVFELSPQSNGSWKETTIHAFTGPPDGAIPSAGLVLGSMGNLYGMTQDGGTAPCDRYALLPGCGTIYKLTPNSGGGWTEMVMYNFIRGGGRGVYPSGGLLLDKTDRLVGTTRSGGDGIGTIFRLYDSQKASWQQNVLHRFWGGQIDGWYPVGRLVTDTNGDLFGVTLAAGTNDDGVVFELVNLAGRWEERILYNFASGSTGTTPQGGLVLDSQGHLYGTTPTGGTAKFGTIYEIAP
jgi:uncharacterized repeat protein (TIGR03803 family)